MEAKETEIAEEEIDLAPVHAILDSFPSRDRRYLIPMLQKVQGVYRYLPDKAVQILDGSIGTHSGRDIWSDLFLPWTPHYRTGKIHN